MSTEHRFIHNFWSFLLGVTVTALAAALCWTLATPRLTVRARTALPTRTGPWGELAATEVPLANPNGVLPDQKERLQKPAWFFQNFTEAQLVQLLRTCDLRPVQRRILFDKQFWQVTSNGCTITPPEPVIWSLDSRARSILYGALANCPSNYAQCYPFRFAGESFTQQLRASGLSETDIQIVKRLAYTNAGAVCFTDLRAIHDVLQPAEFEDLVGALYQVPAYSLELTVPPEADVEGMVRYWGKAHREKIVSPLLKGLARVPGGGAINVAQLLPPFARARLYSYPDAWNDPNAPREDCFYTAMNFFTETPDTNYFDRAYTERVLGEDYCAVDGTATFGDRLLFVDAQERGVHMCVYIAGDFVFTKNGINRAEPWVLMRLADVLSIYLGPHHNGRMVICRPKDKALLPGI